MRWWQWWCWNTCFRLLDSDRGGQIVSVHNPVRARRASRVVIAADYDFDSLLPLAGLREELVAIGKAIGLEEEAEQDSAVRRHGFVLIAGRPPDELTRSTLSLVIFERTFDHISLLECGVFVQRHNSAGIELEQRRGDAAVVGVQHLDRDPGKPGFLPLHIGNV